MRPIDADALISFIDMGHLRNPLENCFSEQDVVDMLESQPTLTLDDLRPKERAMWLPYYNGGLDRLEYRCSKCWNRTPDNQDPRCLDCGSEMLREM